MIKILFIFLELFTTRAVYIAPVSMVGQAGNFFFGTNTADKSAGIWESNSPGSIHGNRRYQVWIDKDATHWYCKKLVLDTMILHTTSVSSPYFSWFNSSGEMKVSTGSQMLTYMTNTLTIPLSHVTGTKRQETYSGVTASSGNYTITFSSAYSVAPNLQINAVSTNTNIYSKTTVTATGFTINIFQRGVLTVPLVGDVLSGVTSAVSGASVDVLITEK